jgi:slime mold repeat-containing protein
MNTIPSDCRSYLKRVLFSALLGAAFSLFLWPMGSAKADLANCPVPPNPGQCICHNFEHVQDEICPSGSGIVNGHDAHIECFDAGGVDCSVEDRCGKCNGCGDGVIDAAGEECDDGNNLSGDGCSADCKIECKTDGDCDDGKFCDGVEKCVKNDGDLFGSCQPGTDPCVGGAECDNVCDEVSRTCHTPADTPCTSDDKQCTNDVCNGQGACTHPSTDGAPCDDKNPCTENDTCTGDSCGGTPKDCSNDVQCDIDSCIPDPQNPNAPLCKHDDTTCHCTKVDDPICNDNEICTDDSCNTQTGECVFTPNNKSCNDGMFCNGDDTCSGGTCSQHSGNPCTTECNNSCTNDPQSCASPQGTQCTSDGNPCTDDVCIVENGEGACSHPNNVAECSDQSACTVNDVCADGVCSSGGPLDCDDHNSCTDDSCDPQNGCSRVDNGTCGGAVVPNPPPPTFLSGAPPGNGCGHSLQGQYTSSAMNLQDALMWFGWFMIIPLVRISKLGVWSKNRK